MSALPHRIAGIALCLSIGALGGLAARSLVPASSATGLALGGAYGLAFALLAAPRAATPGAGLVWGLGFSFVLWLAVPVGLGSAAAGGMHAMGILDSTRARFPDLVSHVLCFGAPLGIGLGTWGLLRPEVERPRFSWPRALVVGGLAVVVGGWASGDGWRR